MTIYRETDTGETYPGLLVTETTTADDLAEFVDCDPDVIGGDHDGWFSVPALATDESMGDVYDGDLILRDSTTGDLFRAVNPYAWDSITE